MRPIDADALYDKAQAWYKNAPTPYRKIYSEFVDVIADAPTIEVVHCKDCKHLYFKDFSAFCPHRLVA